LKGDIMQFPKILKNERVKANLKQAELGDKVNLSIKAISKYETGLREPKIETLIAFADLFNVSLDYLVGRDCEQKAQQQDSILNNLSTEQFSFEEEHLVQMFRALSDDDKEKVIAITKTLHDMDKKSSGEKQTS